MIAMDYFFYLHIPAKYLQFRKNILIWVIHFIIKSIRKGIKILIKRMFSFWAILFNMKLLVILFMRKTQAFVRKNFWFTSNKLPDLLTAELFFKLCISQRYVRNLNWKTSLCISVKNFANLKIFQLRGRLS